MYIFLATNEKYYSRLMMNLFDEPVSHIATGFFIGTMDLVVECTKPFGRLSHLNHWKTQYDIIYSMELLLDPYTERTLYDKVCADAVLSPYDWGAYYYGLYRGVRKWLLNSKFPKHNIGQDPNKRLCTEILYALKDPFLDYNIDISHIDLAAVTPHMIGTELYRQSSSNPKVRWSGHGYS